MKLYNHAQGSTYVTFSDMIKIQLHESSNEQEIQIVKDNPEANVILTLPLKDHGNVSSIYYKQKIYMDTELSLDQFLNLLVTNIHLVLLGYYFQY